MAEKKILAPVYYGIMATWGPTGLTPKQIDDLEAMVAHIVQQAKEDGIHAVGGAELIRRTLGAQKETPQPPEAWPEYDR